MKVIKGIVSHIRHTAEVSGNQHGVATSQIVGFRIGRQSVQLSMPTLPQVEEGDVVAVAGDISSGVLIARAYRNFANDAYGKWRHDWLVSSIITGIVFLPLVALFVLRGLRGDGEIPWAILIYVVPFLPFPFWAYSGVTQSIATNLAAWRVWSVQT